MRLSLTKHAVDAAGDQLLRREAHWLRQLQEVTELEGQIPRLLEEGTGADGRRFLVLALPASLSASGETRSFTESHGRFLARLGRARFRSTDFELSGTGEWLQRSLARVEPLASPQRLRTLRDAFHDCESALLYWTGPYVLSQGEFAPWNVRMFGRQLFVSDWGRARSDASPLDDVLHYLMIQRRLKTVPLLRRAMRRAHDFALAAYPEWSWRPQVIGALTLVYLLGVILHRGVNNDERAVDPVVAAYWKLLEKRTMWMKEN
jgi:hypothetical protein